MHPHSEFEENQSNTLWAPMNAKVLCYFSAATPSEFAPVTRFMCFMCKKKLRPQPASHLKLSLLSVQVVISMIWNKYLLSDFQLSSTVSVPEKLWSHMRYSARYRTGCWEIFYSFLHYANYAESAQMEVDTFFFFTKVDAPPQTNPSAILSVVPLFSCASSTVNLPAKIWTIRFLEN